MSAVAVRVPDDIRNRTLAILRHPATPWAVVALGIGLRAWIALEIGVTGDMQHFQVAGDAWRSRGFHAYAGLNGFDPLHPFDYRHYSYPPGMMPWFAFADTVGPFR